MEDKGVMGFVQPKSPLDTVSIEEMAARAEGTLAAGFTYSSGSQPLVGYVIKRGIGHGGFGEVYYATSEAGKEVALKLIRRNLEIELRGLRQCLNLKHPHLLHIYDIRQDGQDNCWVVMEYVAGPSLEQRIAACPQGLPEAEVLQWVQGIAAGVGYLHEHGIVHRDLKPGNIFCEEGIVKIGDYGLSKFISCSRRSGQTESVGTVHYMAPEVANGRYGKEIDIYALGVILYEMLTGRVPFEGESVAEVLMKHLTAKPDVSILAEPYRSVVAKALEKDPAKRFGSISEMIAALGTGASGPGGVGAGPAPLGLGQGGKVVGCTTSGVVAAAAVPGSVDAEVIPSLTAQGKSFRQKVKNLPARLLQAWNAWKLNPLMKVLLLGLGILAFLTMPHILLPLALLVLVGYGVYGLGRKIFGSAVGKTPGGVSGPSAGSVPIRPEVRGRARASPLSPSRPYRATPYEEAAHALMCKSKLERVTELVGSLLVGAIAALIMCVVIVVLYSFRQHGEMLAPEQIAWLALMSIAGTWAVLTASKFWEGSQGEPMLRRFVLLIVGLGLGVLGYGISQWLWVELGTLENFPRPHKYPLPQGFYGPGGEPLIMAFLATFGTLLVLIRWWHQADPLRFTRLNLWSVLVCVLMAALVAGVFRFPQPWLPMIAGAMSVAIQLAAPWSHPRRRDLRHPSLWP